jgi:hypothetical protein
MLDVRMREHVIVVPHCGLHEVEGIIPRHLAAAGWQLTTTTTLRGDDALAAATRMLVDAPGAQALVAYDLIPAGVDEPVTVVRGITDTPTPWDPLLAGELSKVTGGWAYAVLVDRARLEFGLAAFYAGCTLEAAFAGDDDERFGWSPRGPRLDEALTRDTWARLHTWIARADPHDLRADADGAVACWLAHPPSEPPFALDALASPLLVRAVFPAVTAAQVRTALGAHAPATAPTLVERATTVLQTPYVLAEGELAEPLFVEVARALGGTAVRLELGGGTGAFSWTEVTAEEVRSGHGQGALALATVLGAVAQVLGEPVSAIR